eukprot:CAMPEP_0198293756 /NCGR_PEP_ID=MMETSP1449-20131203/18728_1 /TAXON_ID=420275 /ORGANISM="Attheya septentrionalis, Strain CCMP2084" /LENGTH=349 /DNA_ID=CAMNT_0043993467 /DNA_START=98 /DNA_END=1147 /DNA_ORIENTATION=+
MAVATTLCVVLLLVDAAQCFSLNTRSFMTMSMSTSGKPKGCAAKPFERKNVAVIGGAGYLGGTIFGFLQRASTIHGTGIAGPTSLSPRCICATGAGSMSLNRILSKSFRLAYAGEDLVKLTNMQDVSAISKQLEWADAVILGTANQLQTAPVTGNTYETSPNQKTLELYLDTQSSRGTLDEDDTMTKDPIVQLQMFKNTIQACKEAAVGHVVVVQTPQTQDPQAFGKILDESGLKFTYIVSGSTMESVKDYTFYKGVQGNLNIEGLTIDKDGNSISSLLNNDDTGTDRTIAREDIAALSVQCLLSLDWDTSRYINVENGGQLTADTPARVDKEWCVNSDQLAMKLTSIQ